MKGHPPLKRLPRGCPGLPTGDDWTLRTPISNPLIVDLCATDTRTHSQHRKLRKGLVKGEEGPDQGDTPDPHPSGYRPSPV